jgi:hypothetical protein
MARKRRSGGGEQATILPISTPIITHTTEPPTGDEQYLRAEEVFAALLEDLDVLTLQHLRILDDDALRWRLEVIQEYVVVYETLTDFLAEQAEWIAKRLEHKPKGRRT